MLDIGQRLPIIRDRMTVESLIENRYQIVNRLPSVSARHERFHLRRINGGTGQAILSFCQTGALLSAELLTRQRKMVETLMRPPVALLCRVIESRVESDFQMTIAEFPGEMTLSAFVAGRKSLRMEEVEAFLRLLTEACEAAAQLGWPRLALDLGHLYLDPRLGLPRVPAPDLPLFDGDEKTAIPLTTAEYVPAFATLCCGLLGISPQEICSPVLSARQGTILRQALSQSAGTSFSSARSFTDALFGQNAENMMAAHTERLRSLTATMSQTGPEVPMQFSALTIKMPPPVPSPPVKPVDVLSLTATDRELLPTLKPTQRLRLLPHSEDAPVFALVSDQWISLGRSVGDADFIAQFRPRSNVNDARSRRVSRTQARVLKLGQKLVVDEEGPMNPSLVGDSPIGSHAEMELPASFLLAGEYPVEVRHVMSDYRTPREFGGASVPDTVGLGGSLLVRANGSGVFLNETALLFSDIGLHFSESGRPWLRADTGTMPIARLHRYADQFWLEPIDVTNVTRNNGRTKAHELILLQNGVKITIGAYTYTVQSYSVSNGVTTRGAFTSRRN